MFQQVTIGAIEKKQDYGAPKIGDMCYIGCNAIILGSITIGQNVTIGAAAIVTHDVPDNSVVTGVNQIRAKRIDCKICE